MLRFINARTSFAGVYPRADAPSFSIPTSWRSPTTNISADGAAALARAVASTLMEPEGQSTGFSEDQPAMFMDALARLDYKAGMTNYREFVTNSITETANGFNVTELHGIPIAVEWGVAAARAHLAYNDSQLLEIAVSLWNSVNAYLVTPNDAATGLHPLRNVSIPESCGGGTAAGAVFANAEPGDDVSVNTVTTGGFSTLSAYLFEITSEVKYRAAAELSAQFLRNVMLNKGIIQDTILLKGCDLSNSFLTYNSGKTSEAISIIASSNGSWTPFLNRLVASTVPFVYWTGADGVITEGPSTSDYEQGYLFAGPRKGYFIRGLYEAWERTSDIAMARYIEAYLTVQFNALQDLARSPGTNNYSPTWTGRAPSASLIPEGQLAALDVLSSQIGFARARDASASAVNNTVPSPTNVPMPMFTPLDSPPPSHSPSPSPSLSPSSSPSSSLLPTVTPTPSATAHRTSAKIVAGSVCGGLVLVVLVLLGIWYIRRRRWLPRHRPDKATKTDPRLLVPQPFLMTQSTVPTLPQKRRPPPSPEEAATNVLDGANQRHDASLDAGPSGDIGSARGSQGVVRGSNEGPDSEEDGHCRGEDELVPAPSLIERLHILVTRLTPRHTRGALPRYYTRSRA